MNPILSTVKDQDENLEVGMLLMSLRSVKDSAVGIARSRAIEVKGGWCESPFCPVTAIVGVPLTILSVP